MPPASSPIEAPAEAMKAKTPIAFACSRGSGNIVTIMPRITAEPIAPPAPWMKRAPISMPWVCAMAHTAEAVVKMARPIRKMRRWPIRSPSLPASSSRPPNAIRYAFTTHARLPCVKPRSSLIVGSATFTIVESSTIMSNPPQRTYSASHRCRSFSLVSAVTY